jgi:aspartate 1-decarboxylase
VEKVIIMISFTLSDKPIEPKIVFVDKNNKIIDRNDFSSI